MPYTAPVSVDEACRVLASTPESRVFAGATDIIPRARAEKRLPELLVDLKRIPRLIALASDDSMWTIGAATPAARLTRDDDLRSDVPGLVEAVGLIGSDQIQSRASLGGNLCNASPAADSGPSLVVNDVTVVVASAKGERSMSVSDVTTGPGSTALQDDEFIVEFLAKRPGRETSDAYLRFTPRTEMDIAVVGAAARVAMAESGECTSVDVVLGAVAPTTIRVEGVADVLVGRPLTDESLEMAARLSSDQARPIDDKRGTTDFRTHIAGVLTKRVILIAAGRVEARS